MKTSPRSRGSRSGTRASGSSVPRVAGSCPQLVADLRKRAPGIELRVNEGASERLLAEVLEPGAGAGRHHRTRSRRAPGGGAPARRRARRPRAARDRASGGARAVRAPGRDAARASARGQPVAHRDRAGRARARRRRCTCRVEVEGIRLIADLVAAGAGVSILPETAIPPELASVSIFSIVGPSATAARPHLAEGGTAVARGPRGARDRPRDRGQRPVASTAGRPRRQRPLAGTPEDERRAAEVERSGLSRRGHPRAARTRAWSRRRARGGRVLRPATRARPHRRDSSTTSPSSSPAKNPTAAGSDGVDITTRRSRTRSAARRRRLGPPLRLEERASCLGRGHELGCARMVGVHLRELHDRAVCFAGLEERFLPVRVGRG